MTEWILVSGDAKVDANYLLSLPVVWRRRELDRLELVHGRGHRWNVERKIKEAGIDSPPVPSLGGREAALKAARGGFRDQLF